MKTPFVILALIIVAPTLLFGCVKKTVPPPAETKGTLVTLAQVMRRDVPVVLDSVGRVESRATPEVSAEVPGRIIAILHDAGDKVQAGTPLAHLETTQLTQEERAATADVARLDAQIAQDRRTLERNKDLVARNFISRAVLDASASQLAAQEAAGEAAQSRLVMARDRLAKAVVLAPITGTVESRKVSVGDHVKEGTPLFLIAQGGNLRAQLPFPETVARHLRAGMKVALVSPIAPDEKVSTVVTELRPMVGAGSRSITAVVDFPNPGAWRAGASVTGFVEIDVRQNALLVPESSIVRRPAGEVVYVVSEDKARQVIVRIGERKDGMAEILSGLSGPETVAVDGAAYLSDGAAVRTVKSAP